MDTEARQRIVALETEVARLRQEVTERREPAGFDDATRTRSGSDFEPMAAGQSDMQHAVSRRLLLGAGGVGVAASALGALMTTSSSPALAEAEVVLESGGTAWSVKDGSLGSISVTPAVGDGVADDTLAFQEHLNVLAFAGGGILFVPMGRYNISDTLTVQARVHLVGEGEQRAPKGYTGTAASVLMAKFSGTLIDVTGSYASLQNLYIMNGGAHAQNADSNTPSIRIANELVTVADCMIYRQGSAALFLEAGSGRSRILRNRIAATSQQFNRTTQSNGIVLNTVPDTIIMANDVAADGIAIFLQGTAANIVSNNFIYNSTEGIRLHGQGWNTISNNRLDEHDRTAIVIDLGSRSNVLNGNTIVLNGADASAPSQQRSGIVIGPNSNGISPPVANTISGNTFSNRTHGSIDRTQQYGVILRSGTAGNLVASNTFYDQRVASILDQSGGANTIATNAILAEGT